MHGEYKVPGGKLVVVDLDVVDGRFAGFRLAGDFFLEPDTALDDIDRAVVGLPATSDAKTIAAAIRQALPAEAVLLGFTPEASPSRSAARCSRRRAGATTTGGSCTRRPSPGDAPRARRGADRRWSVRAAASRPSASGSGPAGRRDRQLPVAAQRGRPRERREVRRRGRPPHLGRWRDVHGGGERRHLLALRSGRSGAGPDLRRLLRVPRRVGRSARCSRSASTRHQPLNDITSPSGKIGGAAQKRLGSGAVLHHVTMSYDIDAEKMVQVLRIAARSSPTRASPPPSSASTRCAARPGSAAPEIIERMIATFVQLHGGTAGI